MTKQPNHVECPNCLTWFTWYIGPYDYEDINCPNCGYTPEEGEE